MTDVQRTIFEVFADVKRQVAPVGKDSHNSQQNFKFRGVDAVVNAAAAALDEHGVITVPVLEKYEYGQVEVGNNRTRMAHVRVEVTYEFYGPRGDCFRAKVPGEAMDSGDKGTAKAMSVAYRTCLIQTLNLPTGEPDPDESTYERSPGSAGEAFQNATPHRPLPADDPWRPKVDAVQTTEDADTLLGELRSLVQGGEMASDRADQIKAALDAKVAQIRKQSRNRPKADDRDRQQPKRQQGAQEPADDPAWVDAFRASLANASVLSDLDGKRGELGRAIAERRITPDTGTTLSNEYAARRRELQQESEPAGATA